MVGACQGFVEEDLAIWPRLKASAFPLLGKKEIQKIEPMRKRCIDVSKRVPADSCSTPFADRSSGVARSCLTHLLMVDRPTPIDSAASRIV